MKVYIIIAKGGYDDEVIDSVYADFEQAFEKCQQIRAYRVEEHEVIE